MITSQRHAIEGPSGRIEYALDPPSGPSCGWAFIGHPHPLYGGTLDNKVAATLARAFAALGWIAVRPNFRGVGASAGVHDGGIGETQDFLHLIDTLARAPAASDGAPAPPLALAGFSFGSFVAARAAAALAERGRAVQALVLVGAAAGKWPMPPVDATSLVIHGEVDETIPLADVLAWARGSEVPVVVLPGADHFFHRRLAPLKRIVMQNLAGAAQLAAPMSAPMSAQMSVQVAAVSGVPTTEGVDDE
jgi:alpha/beta superfamily hydrolase